MAFGQHWEWRGFARAPAEITARLERLPLKFPEVQRLTDEYLWTPSTEINVKLRLGDLKLKRFLERRASEHAPTIERWLEDPGENFSFPLAAARLRALEEALRLEPESLGDQTLAREPLLAALGSRAQCIAVVKSRRQYWLDCAGGDRVTVELAEISAPERLVSVGLEHEDPDRLLAALGELAPGPELRSLNYLDAIAIWAHGDRVLP